MKSVIDVLENGLYDLDPIVADELVGNNCSMPDISRVIYNVGTKSRPKVSETGEYVKDENGKVVYGEPETVLATIVYFDDDTMISVVSSEHDGLSFSDKKLSDGSVIKVASDQSKEIGLVYALLKRTCAEPNKDGKLEAPGFGRILRDIVNKAYDVQYENAETKLKKAAAKKRHAELQANAKPKRKRCSLEGTLYRINSLLDKLDASDSAAVKEAVSKIMTEIPVNG